MAINAPAPEDGENDEHRTVGRIDPTKGMLTALENRDDAIEGQRKEASSTEESSPPPTQPEPDQVAAANFKQTSEDEQGNRAHEPFYR